MLTNEEVVGEGDFVIMDAVENATPEYFSDWRSMVYLFRSRMLAWCLKCFSPCASEGTESKMRWVMNGFSLGVAAS